MGARTQHRYKYSGTASYQLVSNPYRALTDATMGWTRTMTDQMGRSVETQTFSCASPCSTLAALPAPWGSGTGTGTVATSYDVGTGPGGVLGRKITVTDQNSNARTTVHDALGHLAEVDENCQTGCTNSPTTYSTVYTYDASDNLRTVAQGTQNRTFVYDSLGRLSSATNPEHGPGTTNYLYDDRNNLTQKSLANDVTTNYTYDQQNRVTGKSYSNRAYGSTSITTPPVSYCYDGKVLISGACTTPTSVIPFPIGHLTWVGNSVSNTIYGQFDQMGRVLASSQTTSGQSNPFPFAYAYNNAGGLTSITYPSNRVVSYTYDAAGRVASVLNGSTTSTDKYASGIGYTPHGAITQMTLGAQTETSSYNNRLQPASLTVNVSTTGLLALNYYYCANLAQSCTTNNGNLLTETMGAAKYNMSLTQNFGYDGLNRLLTASEPTPANPAVAAWSQTQGYDQYGNRWMAANPGLPPVTTSVPTTQAGVSATNNRLSVAGVTYDTGGNVSTYNSAALYYDGENRLVQAVNASTFTYSYDGEGRRVQRTDNNGTVTLVYDAQGQLAAEYGPTADYPDTGRQFLTADHLGSTRLVTDAAGNDVARYDYLPFGEEIGLLNGRTTAMHYGSASDLKQKFTGKERDAETGLDYFGARYMSSAQGRFMNPDSPLADQNIFDPQSWNLYTYVRNNPLRFVDRTGTQAQAVNLAGWLATHEPELAAAARAVMVAKDIHTFSQALKEVVWGASTPSEKIEAALASDNIGVAMEGITAYKVELRYGGFGGWGQGDLVGVNVPVPDPTNPGDLLTDLDIQLKFAIVEIKTGTKRLGKGLEEKKKFGLPVVVYAPQATLNQQTDIRNKGATWVGNFEDLFAQLDRLKAEAAKKPHVRSKVKYPKAKSDQQQE